MKPLTFARLLLETSLLQDLNVLETQAFGASTCSTGHQKFGFPDSQRMPAGTAPRACAPGHVNDVLIGKATGGDVSVAYNDPSPMTNREIQTAREGEAPYLLLDARVVEEWTAGHLVGARSYPAALRSRAAGPVASKELLAYKNKPDRFILVYDEDEREAPLLAQSMAERGVENCYLLSGGIKAIMSKGIQGIFIGTLPPSCRNLPPPPSNVGRTKPGSSVSRVPSGRNTATSMRSSYGLSGGSEGSRRTSVTEKIGSSGMAGLVRISEPPVGYGYSSFDLGALRESLNNVSPTESNVSRMTGRNKA